MSKREKLRAHDSFLHPEVVLGLVALLVASAWTLPVHAEDRPRGLAEVETIYVVPLGESDAARRYRAMLVERLDAEGFRIAHDRQKADAVLSGSVTSTSRRGKPLLLFRTVVLKGPGGENLWYAKIRPTTAMHRQARRIARQLRADWKRATWAADRD